MHIYLLRHGDAVSQAPNDALRVLSALGQEQISQIATDFVDHGFTVDLCIASPYVRTRQTAELFLNAYVLARQKNELHNIVINHNLQQQFDQNNNSKMPSFYCLSGLSPSSGVKHQFKEIVKQASLLEQGNLDDQVATEKKFCQTSLLVVGHNPQISELSALIQYGVVQEANPMGTAELRAYEMDFVTFGEGNLLKTLFSRFGSNA